MLKLGKDTAFPKLITPMLATLADEPFELDEWFYEPKLDGIRVIAYVKNGIAELSSRRGLNLTEKYPSITESLSSYRDLVFDGEIVALDEQGKPSFQYLQQSGTGLRSFKMGSEKRAHLHLVYYVFDILNLSGKSLLNVPLKNRKEILDIVLRDDLAVKKVRSLGSDGPAAFAACVENGLEGIVGKKENSTYDAGARTRSWLKFKSALSDELLICGYTEGTGTRSDTFGSLLLGEYDNEGKLHFVGGVGTGFNGKKLSDLLAKMTPLQTEKCPFDKKPPRKLNPTWVKPQLVAEVKYMERTQDKMLRAPVFLCLREDIEPCSVKEPDLVHVKVDHGRSLSLTKGLAAFRKKA